jgi:hypothetical protein
MLEQVILALKVVAFVLVAFDAALMIILLLEVMLGGGRND